MLEKVYVVCLPQRRAYVDNVLASINFSDISNDFLGIEIIDAPIGANLTQESLQEMGLGILEEYRDPIKGRILTSGEVAGTIGHILAWRKIVKDNIKFAIILEDDIEFCTNFKSKMCDIIEQLRNKKMDLLYLGRKKISKEYEKKYSNDIVYAKFSYWTCAYLISNNGANKLLNKAYITKIIPTDDFLAAVTHSHYDKKINFHYPKNNKIELLAINEGENIIYPKAEAFAESATEKSPLFPFNAKPADYKNTILNVITVATEKNDGFKRLKDSAKTYGINLEILGLGEKWESGVIRYEPGGAQKIFLLKKALKKLLNNKKNVVMFIDGYDTLINSSPYEIIDKFLEYNANIVFAAEPSCWPDSNRVGEYPESAYANKFLNSGTFIGYAKDIDRIIDTDKLSLKSDDQRYYTTQFLENNLKDNDMKITLDYECRLFQTINGQKCNVEIDYNYGRLHNKVYNEYPCVLHANGPDDVKVFFNGLTNFIPIKKLSIFGDIENHVVNTTTDSDCSIKNKTLSVNLFFLSFEDNTLFLNNIFGLSYDPSLIDLTFFCSKHAEIKIKAMFGAELRKYNNISWVQTFSKSAYYRNRSVADFLKSKSDYYIAIDNNFIIEKVDCFESLLAAKQDIVSPVMKAKEGHWANFWYDIESNGYYKNHPTYYRILLNDLKGLFSVPYTYGMYMANRSIFENFEYPFSSTMYEENNYDMSFCLNLREKNQFIFTTNESYYGYIDAVQSDYSGPDDIFAYEKEQIQTIKSEDHFLFSYFKNKKLWEEKYLNRKLVARSGFVIDSLANDIFICKIFTEDFCKDIIDIANKLNDWKVDRHENYPTTDMLVDTLGLSDTLREVYKEHLLPIVKHLYHFNSDVVNDETFIAKYESTKTDNQSSLGLHTDKSIFSIIVSLNDDFEGGGTSFPRQKIERIVPPAGNALIFPGRLTHPHAGHPISKGERYLMVSFCN